MHVQELNSRSRSIFRQVVELYLSTGVPVGSIPLANRAGTAWGFIADLGEGTHVYCLPGPPGEADAAFTQGGAEVDLMERFGAAKHLALATFHTACVPENGRLRFKHLNQLALMHWDAAWEAPDWGQRGLGRNKLGDLMRRLLTHIVAQPKEVACLQPVDRQPGGRRPLRVVLKEAAAVLVEYQTGVELYEIQAQFVCATFHAGDLIQ